RDLRVRRSRRAWASRDGAVADGRGAGPRAQRGTIRMAPLPRPGATFGRGSPGPCAPDSSLASPLPRGDRPVRNVRRVDAPREVRHAIRGEGRGPVGARARMAFDSDGHDRRALEARTPRAAPLHARDAAPTRDRRGSRVAVIVAARLLVARPRRPGARARGMDEAPRLRTPRAPRL